MRREDGDDSLRSMSDGFASKMDGRWFGSGSMKFRWQYGDVGKSI